MAKVKLEKEYNYFLSHQAELKSKYLGKIVVIKDGNVLGAYDSMKEAIKATEKKYSLGTFLVKKVEKSKDDSIMRFHSRVYNVKYTSCV